MKTYTEAQRFGIYAKTGNDPMGKRTRAETGRLWLDGRLIATGLWRVLGKERRELLMQGYSKDRVKITY